MIYISHRGNLYGPDKELENTRESIQRAIENGFHCEIDIWFFQETNCFYLGHDFPVHHIELGFLRQIKEFLWVHCKNIDALIALKDEFNCFIHDKDPYTITSKGVVWGNINSKMTKETVCVMPELGNNLSFNAFAICTDYPFHFRNLQQKSPQF